MTETPAPIRFQPGAIVTAVGAFRTATHEETTWLRKDRL